MKREVQNLLLLLLGGAMVKISWDGSFVRYVKPSLHPYLLTAGVLIVALAIASIVADIRRGGPGDDGHDHDSRPYWLLLVPLAVILFIAPPALGVSAVGDRSVTSAADRQRTAFPPLPDELAPEVPLLDVVQRAVRDTEGSLDGREIRVARILIICCAADARSVRIHLDAGSAALDDIPDGTWLQISGTVDAATATEDTAFTPTMTVSTVERIEAPANTYAY